MHGTRRRLAPLLVLQRGFRMPPGDASKPLSPLRGLQSRLLGAPDHGLQCAPNPSRALGGTQTHRPPLPTLAPSSPLQD